MKRDREREVKVSEVQKPVILEFMEQNEDFAKGKLLTAEKKQTWIALWDTLAFKLNSANGARKTTTKWQRAWSDLKNKVKRKAKDIRQMKLKGEWTELSMKLTEFEKRLMKFVTDDALHGIRMYNENNQIVMEIDDIVSNNTSPTSGKNSTNKGEEVTIELMDTYNNCNKSPTSKMNLPEVVIEPIYVNSPVNAPKKTKIAPKIVIKEIKTQEYMQKNLELLTDIAKELKKTNDFVSELIVLARENNTKII